MAIVLNPWDTHVDLNFGQRAGKTSELITRMADEIIRQCPPGYDIQTRMSETTPGRMEYSFTPGLALRLRAEQSQLPEESKPMPTTKTTPRTVHDVIRESDLAHRTQQGWEPVERLPDGKWRVSQSQDVVDRLDALGEENERLDKRAKEAENMLQQANSRALRSAREVDQLSAQVRSLTSERDSFRDRYHAIESDLGKVREHFGAKAFDEAVPGWRDRRRKTTVRVTGAVDYGGLKFPHDSEAIQRSAVNFDARTWYVRQPSALEPFESIGPDGKVIATSEDGKTWRTMRPIGGG